MPPRQRPQFKEESIDQQLSQIHLLDSTSSTENLEQLGPIIKQIHTNRQQDAYLRTLKSLVESKDAEIESICGDNYQDFISSVSTLFTVKSYTVNLREKITSLDAGVSQVGRGLVEKKRALSQAKKTAANLDEAIETLQACLRVLDVVNRCDEMIKSGKYWSALRSLEDIQNLPSTSLSQTPFFQHLLGSLPSVRGQIKDAVNASVKQFLLEIRVISKQVGQLALETMEARTRRWRARREKDPMLRLSKVGSAVEVITYEKNEYNVLDNENLSVDFQPLYQCIHIYAALDSLDELKKSYQADRKDQSDLIIPSLLPIQTLQSVVQEIAGFFIIEVHVLQTTSEGGSAFRSERDVEGLWEATITRLSSVLQWSLRNEADPDGFLRVKELLLELIMTMESYGFSTTSLQAFILVLFEKYSTFLEKQFSKRLDNIVLADENVPMVAENTNHRDSILEVVWLHSQEKHELSRKHAPTNLPWSQSFYLVCQDIRSFVQKFYQFVDGVSQHHRNIDELLSKALRTLLTNHVSESISKRLAATATLSQIAQTVTNLEHFQFACTELECSLTTLRSTERGGTIRLTEATASFSATLALALKRVMGIITSKLDAFFELSEYEWTPPSTEEAPSMYLYELINWLTTVVDELKVQDKYKDEAYRGAVTYVGQSLMSFLTDHQIQCINENAIQNILMDLSFIEDSLDRIGRAHLKDALLDIRHLCDIPLKDAVPDYLVPQNRATKYQGIKTRQLQAFLEKLARYGASCRDAASREKGDRRKREAEAVGRLFPSEAR